MSVTSSLNSVADYVTEARILILDKVRPYRYADEEIVSALNLTLLEARRLRADLFVTRYGNTVPYFGTVSGNPVPIEAQFRLAILFGICAYTLLRDDEDVQDERANTFLLKFQNMLVGKSPLPAPVRGGTPGPGNAQQ